MIPFLLLAAGRSSRMGLAKGLLLYHGRPWLEVQADAIRAQGYAPRIVLAPTDGPTRALAEALGLEVRLNPDPERGPFSSLQAGLAGLRAPCFVGPVDVPVTSLLGRLEAALGTWEAVQPSCEGRGGHPILLGPALASRLEALDPREPEARLDLQLRRARTLRLEVDEGRILLNLNTPEAWAAYCAQNR